MIDLESVFEKALKKENARTRGNDDLEITEGRDTIHIYILWKARDQKYKSDGFMDSNSKKYERPIFPPIISPKS